MTTEPLPFAALTCRQPRGHRQSDHAARNRRPPRQQQRGAQDWRVTLLSALSAFAAAARLPALINFAPVPIVVFDGLDALYIACAGTRLSNFFATVRQNICEGRYTIAQTYEATAPLEPGAVAAALRSRSV